VHSIERVGRGAIVCVHGFCQSSAYWAPTLDRLAALGAGALAPDLPGFAGSARDPGPYTMPGLADALAAFLDARGLTQVVLVGGSMGGVVAQHFALRHPMRVSRLLLVSTGAATADPAGALAKADVLATAPWNEETVTPIVAGFFYKPQPPEKLAEYRAIARQAAQPAALEAMRSNASLSTFDDLGRIAMPTMIVQGRHDRARTPEHGAEICARLPNGVLHVIEDAGHTPQLEQPDEFHKIALPFLLGQ
jgi:pimeloyl-ACP methyl ester carboxylesterase